MSEQTTETDDTGIERRYEVKKINDPTGKHDDCRYFVLDPQHDPIALAALARYAQVARAERLTALADELDRWVSTIAEEHDHAGDRGRAGVQEHLRALRSAGCICPLALVPGHGLAGEIDRACPVHFPPASEGGA